MNSFISTCFLIKIKFSRRFCLMGTIWPPDLQGCYFLLQPRPRNLHSRYQPLDDTLFLSLLFLPLPHLSGAHEAWHTAIRHRINFFTYRSIFPTHFVFRLPAVLLSLTYHTPTHRPIWVTTQMLFFLTEESLALALYKGQERLYSSWVLPWDSHITQPNMDPLSQIIFSFTITLCVPNGWITFL